MEDSTDIPVGQVTASKLFDRYVHIEALSKACSAPSETLKLSKLFSSLDSGFNPQKFHSSCDGRGPLCIVLKGPVKAGSSRYFCGYTNVPWSSNQNSVGDQQARLFRYDVDQHGKLSGQEIFSPKSNQATVYHNPNHGPAFGASAEAFRICYASTGYDYFNPFSEQHSSSFDFRGESFLAPYQSLCNSNHQGYQGGKTLEGDFQYEVLLVEKAEPFTRGPWLPGVDWSCKAAANLMAMTTSFDPVKGGLPVSNINILLVGGVGSGKSSFISTLDGLIKGRMSRRAPSGTGTGSLTTNLKKYTFQLSDGSHLRWSLWDSMGWEDNLRLLAAMPFALAGQLADGCRLDEKIDTAASAFRHDATIHEAVHCVLVAVPCDSATDSSYMKNFKLIRDEARQRGIPVLVALTKIDKYDPSLGPPLSGEGSRTHRVFHSKRVHKVVQVVGEVSGVGGIKDVFPIKNLTQDETSEGLNAIQVLTLRLLQNALYAASDYLQDQRPMTQAKHGSACDSGAAPAKLNFQDTRTSQINGLVCKEEWRPARFTIPQGAGEDVDISLWSTLSLHANEKVFISPEMIEDGWILAKDTNGREGWIKEEALRLLPARPPSRPATAKN